MSTNLQQSNTAMESLITNIKDSSALRFRQHAANTSVSLTEHNGPIPLMISNWMGIILVAGPGIKVIFKTHFNSKDTLAMAKNAFIALDQMEASTAEIIDFIREYCNLVGGAIKFTLNNIDIDAGVSLPMTTGGFDEVFAESKKSQNSFSSIWHLSFGAFKITCTLEIECMDPDIFKNFGLIPQVAMSSQNEGTLDLL